MKWILVLLNLAAAAAVIWAGFVVCGIHRVHSFSVFVELDKRGALAQPPKPAHPGDPVGADGQYDVAKRLESIGGLGENLGIVTYPAAALFALNAIAFLFVWKRKLATTPPPSH